MATTEPETTVETTTTTEIEETETEELILESENKGKSYSTLLVCCHNTMNSLSPFLPAPVTAFSVTGVNPFLPNPAIAALSPHVLTPSLDISVSQEAPPPPPYYFGNTSIGTNAGWEYGYCEACKYLCGKTGNITNITQHFKQGSGAGRYARVAVYAVDGNGYPSTLLGESANEEILTDGWHTFSNLSIPVVNGTYYCLAFQQSDIHLYPSSFPTNAGWRYRTFSYAAFPNPFNSTGGGTANFSIYAQVV